MTTSRSRTQKRRTATSDNNANFEIIADENRTPSEIDQDLHIPLTSRAVFWQPRHLALSDTLLHVPFLFWLVETCRPANIVQIGTGDGIGFMALCQAVDKLSLAAPCIGLNPVPDTPSLPEPLAEQHRTHYDDFSFVIQDDPANAMRHVHESGIDLLVLNTELTDDLIMALRAHWQSRLSDQAVVVVCNPGRLAQRQPAREFLESLGAACPTIRLQHAENDIETYLVGKDQPERLKKLAALGIGAPGYLAARQVFTRLGQGLHQGQLARAGEVALRKAEAAVDEARKRLGERENELQAIRKEIERAQTSEAEQAAVVADLQARLFDAERALAEEQENSATKEALEKLQAELAESQEKRKAFYTKSADLEARNAELSQKIKESDEAYSRVAKRVPALESQITDLEKANGERLADIAALSDGFEKRLAEMTQTIALLREQKQVLEATVEERVADIAALIRDHEKEREKLSERLAHSEEKRHEFLEAKRNLQEKLATLQSETAEQTAKQLVERDTALAEMARKLEDVTVERDQLQQSMARASGELEQLTRKLEENEAHRNALLNSTSWRVTGPIRKVKQALSREG